MTFRVNLGAGREKLPGYVSVDANARHDPHYICDVRRLPFDDEQVDELRAADILEHLPYRDTRRTLTEWHRVLRPGGTLYLQVPAADLIMRWWCERPDLLVQRVPPELPQTAWAGLVWRLMGGQEDGEISQIGEGHLNLHQNLFNGHELKLLLQYTGFVVTSMSVNEHPNYLIWAAKP